VVVGDGSPGKTSFLRTWMRGLAAGYAEEEGRFTVVDCRRTLGDTPATPVPPARTRWTNEMIQVLLSDEANRSPT
jgi:hypothetical protein